MGKFEVLGCPVADGMPPCCLFCGGGWPGTRITTETMTDGVLSGRIVPKKLGCQPLEDRAREGYVKLNDLGIVPEEYVGP